MAVIVENGVLTDVQAVSGATVTSEAFVESLDSTLSQAIKEKFKGEYWQR